MACAGQCALLWNGNEQMDGSCTCRRRPLLMLYKSTIGRGERTAHEETKVFAATGDHVGKRQRGVF